MNAPAAIRVVIADDHAVVREGIRHVLASDASFDVVGEAAGADDAVALAVGLEPDVVILDVSMPGGSGLGAAARIASAAPDARVLILSIHDHQEYVLEAVRTGARGYLRKDSSPAELRSAVRAVSEGRTVFSAPVAEQLAAALRGEGDPGRDRLARLSVRERDVLVEIAQGWTNKEIAQRLGISPRTVESHREALMRKLELRGVAALTRFALDAGLLPPAKAASEER